MLKITYAEPPPIETIDIPCSVLPRDILTVSCMADDAMFITTHRPNVDEGRAVRVTKEDWKALVAALKPWADSDE
jgi:hypothetical protein